MSNKRQETRYQPWRPCGQNSAYTPHIHRIPEHFLPKCCRHSWNIGLLKSKMWLQNKNPSKLLETKSHSSNRTSRMLLNWIQRGNSTCFFIHGHFVAVSLPVCRTESFIDPPQQAGVQQLLLVVSFLLELLGLRPFYFLLSLFWSSYCFFFLPLPLSMSLWRYKGNLQ